MTALTRVRNALARIPSEHPPFTWGFGPNASVTEKLTETMARRHGLDWARLRRATEDVAWLHPRYIGKPIPPGQAEYMAVWGIETKRVVLNNVVYDDEIARRPLQGARDAGIFDRHPWPSTADYDYEWMKEQKKSLAADGPRAVRLQGGNPFEIYSWMTGLEDTLMDLISEPELVQAGMTHICRFFKAHLEKQVEAVGPDVDLVFIGDDLGSQAGPLISREIYREVIQPFHRDLCLHIRRLLPDTVIEYHTDGSVFDLLPDLREAGVQMLEAVQTECEGMAPERLADAYGQTLMFQGGISVQQVLPKLTPDGVSRECRRLIRTLGRHGGYLAAPSHAIQGGTPTENLLAMLEEVLGPERYQAALKAGAV